VAVGSRDIPYLRRFVTLHPNVSFTVGDTVIGGRNPGPAIRRSAEFTRGERTVATVAVMKPLDERFVGALAGAAGTPRGDLLVIDHGRVVVGVSKGAMLTPVPTRPADVRLGTSDYRALATVGDPGRPSPSIVALEPRDSIDDAVSHAWWRALWAALATLATVGVLAYVAAPLVAGRRWTRRLLPWELEEQFAVEGDGSEPFSAPVPSHGSAPSGGIATTPVPAAAQAANYHVVVIDDDPVERTLIADALRPERIDVAATGDADQALRLLGAGDADLAILDWKMSGRSGAEILAELNIRHPELPVLVVADDLETQQRHVASLLGAGDFLIRPLDESAVVAKVQEVFEREDGRTP
jgi:CheY-like chemotaxis protein